jgi:hypothetical protein
VIDAQLMQQIMDVLIELVTMHLQLITLQILHAIHLKLDVSLKKLEDVELIQLVQILI